jgi:hypothetical protein
MNENKIHFKEDKHKELSGGGLPDGMSLHHIDVFVGDEWVAGFSVSRKYLRYFVGGIDHGTRKI